MIRLREIFIIAMLLALVGAGIWFFKTGTADNAVGAGGLPLIKADASPAKLPPHDPGGEIMPNADSTVFSAMGIDGDADPSMEGVKPPEETSAQTPPADGDFAGLRTGFAVPAAPEPKTESLFEGSTYKDTGSSKYVSGLVDESVPPAEPVVPPVAEEPLKVEPAPEEIKTEPAKVAADTAKQEAAEEPVAEKPAAKKPDVTPTQIPPQPAPIAELIESVSGEDPAAAAQKMEQAEMEAIRPVSKPQAPAADVKPEPEALAPVAETKPQAQPAAPKPEDEPYKPAPKAAAAPSSAPSSAPGGYYIQLASAPEGTDMMASWNRMKAKYAVALAGLSPVTQSADIPGKGTYVRLQAGPMTQAEANDRCKALRGVDPKGGCLVVKR